MIIITIFKRQKDFKHRFHLKKTLPHPNILVRCVSGLRVRWGGQVPHPALLLRIRVPGSSRAEVPHASPSARRRCSQWPNHPGTQFLKFYIPVSEPQLRAREHRHPRMEMFARAGADTEHQPRRAASICHGGWWEQRGCWGLAEMGAAFHPDIMSAFSSE